jgi:acylphosphatase
MKRSNWALTERSKTCRTEVSLMHAQGKLETVQKLVEWCRTGPPKATVTAVDAKTVPISDFTGFKVLR